MCFVFASKMKFGNTHAYKNTTTTTTSNLHKIKTGLRDCNPSMVAVLFIRAAKGVP